MKVSDYTHFVEQRCHDYVDENYCVIALNGEAGEVAEWHKKHTLRGNPGDKLSRTDLLHELGDTLFYLTRLASINGWTLKQVMDANYDKLIARERRGEVSARG